MVIAIIIIIIIIIIMIIAITIIITINITIIIPRPIVQITFDCVGAFLESCDQLAQVHHPAGQEQVHGRML